MLKIINSILDFLFPPDCPVCGKPVKSIGTLCTECFTEIDWINGTRCETCGYPFPDYGGRVEKCPACIIKGGKIKQMRSACVYDEASRKIVLPFKHTGKLRFGITMAGAMANVMSELDKPDLIIPVPLAYWRQVRRGYNQALVLAKLLGKHSDIPIAGGLISRKYRQNQGHKSLKERKANISGVFRVKRPDAVKGKSILIIDDVITTGATLNELAKVLLKAGAKQISAVCFARAVK